ncbi:hypothetical protein BS78_08G019900 [Paspalum vaginatum]|nr:hypothetical protein BS78_08G019900 [Paspalum vaginatum]
MSGPPRRCGGRRPERRAAAVGDCGNGYVEVDPTGRYGRFDDLLGKGAMKSVYRGFDEERGVEVAWNQASLTDVLRTPDAVQRLHAEVQLLRALRHDAIIGFHASWVDVPRRSLNFITELFSSGTLRAYRRRYPRVSRRAVRSWARQVLRGLAYLHAHDPPVIHRDLKCDNLFVNGHQGQVKIGDLGLAAVLRGGAARSVIGTPEFMAPEMYDEEYDERVDVYAFGMCVLEMITVEYPYAECSNPAQIYKKVTAGRLPDAFYRVEDDDARRFIGRCLAAASERPSAAELLLDPFLIDDGQDDQHRRRHDTTTTTTALTASAPSYSAETCCRSDDASSSSSSSLLGHRDDRQAEAEQREDDDHDDAAREQPAARTDMTITGKLNAEEDTVFLRVQITDETGHVRNIYFPFDTASDTAAEVASEMVKELDITDRDAAEIAAMIEQEIDRLLPGREPQHEYTYAAHDDDDDDDDENGERPPPFYYLSSSPTSSQGSLCGVGPYGTGGFYGPQGGGWSKDHWRALSDDDDDGASSASARSGRYSALHYEEEAQPSSSPEAERWGPGSSSSCSSRAGQARNTRFAPGRGGDDGLLARQRQCSVSPAHQHAGRPRRRERDGGDGHGRMPRNRSMVDMRSRLLHRTLVEELNRRLFFNTVGAVENIGFRAPAASSSASSAAAARDGRGRRRGKDDSQYVLL